MWKYPRPHTWQLFEQILADWVQNALGDSAADRYGRTGQRQDGIDILARNWRDVRTGLAPEIWAIQAKDYGTSAPSPGEVHDELAKALAHHPRPDVFVLATTAERDARLQDWAIVASESAHPTRVEVWFWDGLIERCLKEAWFREKYLPSLWSNRIPHQLPSPPADFTGRDADIADVFNCVGDGANTVVLSGMPGIGKTALALALGSGLAARYPDGQLRLELRGTTLATHVSPMEAMMQVVRTFDTQAVAVDESSAENLYHSTLHGKRVLVFADDAFDTNQVQRLVPARGSCLLITSRHRILLPGAVTCVLKILSSSDSHALLMRIAPRIGNAAEEVAALCGHLPLALRLAATTVTERPDVTVDEYVVRLKDERTRLEFVDATVELSYQLLPEDLRDAWKQLSVFRTGFDLRAAAAVLGIHERAAWKMIGSLLRRSMLEWDSALSRYSLHELLRLVAASRLGAPERERLHIRHANDFERRLSALKTEYRIGGESAVSALQQFDHEVSHVRQAVEWLREHMHASHSHKELLSLFLDRGVDIFPIRLGVEELVDWLNDAVSATRDLNQQGATAAHLGNLGVALARAGDDRNATRVQEECLSLARESNDAGGIARALGNLATLYLQVKDFKKSIDLASESIQIERRLGNKKGAAADFNTLGNAYVLKGDYDKAIVMFAQSLSMKREIGDQLGEATTWVGLGSLYAAKGRHVEAAGYFWHAIAIFQRLRYNEGERRARGALCISILKAGAVGGLSPEQLTEMLEHPPDDDAELAKRVVGHLSARATRARALGNSVEYAALIGDIGTLQAALGEEELALSLHNESIQVAHAAGEGKLEANSHFNKAASLARLDRIDEAIEAMQAAHRMYKRLGLRDAEDAETELERLKKTLKQTTSEDQRTDARPRTKLGRNDKCPCGSGKKYKHCCLGKA
jgi:tetratricopeptide (TPR) repeat protein